MFLFDLEFARSSCIDSLVQPRGLASRELWCGSSSPLGVIDWGHRYPSLLHCKWILTTFLGEILGFIWFYIVLFVRFVESIWGLVKKYGSPVWTLWFWQKVNCRSHQFRNSSTSFWVLPPASFSLSSIMKPSKNYELGVMTFCRWIFFSSTIFRGWTQPWSMALAQPGSRAAEPRCHGAMTDVGLCSEKERWLNEVPKAPWWGEADEWQLAGGFSWVKNHKN